MIKGRNNEKHNFSFLDYVFVLFFVFAVVFFYFKFFVNQSYGDMVESSVNQYKNDTSFSK
ncbi:hypothetical protein SJPD1_0766 [Sulfurospirillum diekertiae]|uniref:Uncharacterized protein n=1 Tax=Sulfurospirillum diekertiae TaxID=1854492 RepID=A0A290HT92_9BACT|nr:hypothetical protein [Sulfurospirillum diekertiae]ATB68880.1 hypothetical protein SJPD1_0766 [Sulfurospirillum diekertiae]